MTQKIWTRAQEIAVEFREDLDARKQRPEQSYAQSLQSFDQHTPELGQDGVEVIDELAELATPGLHAMTGARFFGWVIGATHEVGVAADWLTAAWGQNAGNHHAAPAAAAAEESSARWLLDILGLPVESSVGFVSGCTMANFVCLAAARGEVLRRLNWDVEADGLFGAPPIRVILGADAHSTVFSALKCLGMGQSRVTLVPTDSEGSMLAEAFQEVMRDAAHEPAVIVIAQAGQINTGAFDPFQSIAEASRAHPNCWLHIDGAFGLWARASSERSHLTYGLERADSWATDGHKWLQTPHDCGYAIVQNSEAHKRAMTTAASYLPSSAESERDPSHLVPELSRRARGFATWAMLKHLGRQGISNLVDRHCQLAQLIAQHLEALEGVEIMNEVVLNQVAVRFGRDLSDEDSEDLTKRIISLVQEAGECFVGGARWKGGTGLCVFR